MTTSRAAAVIALEELARWLDERATEADAIRNVAETIVATGGRPGPDAPRPEHFAGEAAAFRVAATFTRRVIEELPARHLRAVGDKP